MLFSQVSATKPAQNILVNEKSPWEPTFLVDTFPLKAGHAFNPTAAAVITKTAETSNHFISQYVLH